MSIHKTLKIDKYKTKRSVRTRRERVKRLLEKNKLNSVYKLPKEKVIRLKLKKEKKEKIIEEKPFEYKESKHKKISKDVGNIK